VGRAQVFLPLSPLSPRERGQGGPDRLHG
jgi:hypothetical protein